MTPRERLTAYHSGDKVKIGNAYFAKPHEPAPLAEKPDPLLIAQLQIAQSYFGWAQALKTLQD